MIHVLAHLAAEVPAATGTGQVSTVLAILATLVVVVGGLGGLVRAIWRVSTMLRDNTMAIHGLTTRMEELAVSVDGRFDKLAERVAQLEWLEYGRQPPGKGLPPPGGKP